MKKLLCLVLAAMLLCAAGSAEGFGLKERRPAAGDVSLGGEPAATEAPADGDAAEENAESAQQTLDDLLGGLASGGSAEESAAQQPSGMVTDPRLVDIANMDDMQLNELGSRISRELERRAMEEAGVSLGEGTVVVDQDGVRVTLYEATVQFGDGALRIGATVENGSDRDLSLDVVLAEINGLSVLGYGVYSVYAGETVTDYILFDAEGDEEVAAALAAPESLRFTIWAYDNGTGETYFTADVTL